MIIHRSCNTAGQVWGMAKIISIGALIVVSVVLIDIRQESSIIRRKTPLLKDQLPSKIGPNLCNGTVNEADDCHVLNQTTLHLTNKSTISQPAPAKQNYIKAPLPITTKSFLLLDTITDSLRTNRSMPPWSTNVDFGTSVCNCLTLPSTSEQDSCCTRLVSSSHKMGLIFTMKLFRGYKTIVSKDAVAPQPYDRLHQWDSTVASKLGAQLRQRRNQHSIQDFRNVLMVRNIYDALASGYLYHLTGRECWLDPMGLPYQVAPLRRILDWKKYTSFTNSVAGKRASASYLVTNGKHAIDSNYTLCDYLAEHSEKEGMQVYIEWVFRFHYRKEGSFAQIAWARQYDHIRNRTMVVCYDELMNQTASVVERILDFVFPSGHGVFQMPLELPDEWLRESLSKIPFKTSPHGVPPHWRRERLLQASGHATSHDPLLRARLREIVNELDQTLYDGQIAWLASVLPC